MKRLTTHGKLQGLSWLALIFSASLVTLAGCGGLLPDQQLHPKTANVDVLSYVDIETRFMQVPGLSWDQLDPAVRACIRAEAYCTGFVFHPAHTANKRLGALVPDLLGFARITRSSRWSADVTLLVMNGRVVHKVFSGALARAAGSAPTYY
jgi:hypothetical protein